MSEDTGLTVVPEPQGFAAAVHGIDLRVPLSSAAQRALLAAWTDHAVLYFPEQLLDPTMLERISAYLGPFGHDPYVRAKHGYEHVIEVCREARETAPIFGSMWHSDWSFQATPPSATLLYGESVPPRGGDTVFADGYRAFEALSPTMQNLLLPLNVM